MEEQHLKVRVAGWRYPRHVVVREDTVAMEIARTHCSHCPTCSSRIRHCESALTGKEFERQSAGGGEYFILAYPAEDNRDPQSIATFLAESLRLGITIV